MDRRFDATAELIHEVANRLETRLDLQAGKITSGTRWIARSDEWQNRVDKILADQAKRTRGKGSVHTIHDNKPRRGVAQVS